MHAFGGASSVSTRSSTVTMERFAASTASFCTPTMPHSRTFPLASAFCAWMTETSGRTEGVAAKASCVKGHTMVRMFGLTRGKSEPA
jgi:hypothetical protein